VPEIDPDVFIDVSPTCIKETDGTSAGQRVVGVVFDGRFDVGQTRECGDPRGLL